MDGTRDAWYPWITHERRVIAMRQEAKKRCQPHPENEGPLAGVDIVGTIGRYVPLNPWGRHVYTGACPFHDKPTWGLYVSRRLGMWWCRSCRMFGHADDFVMRLEGCNREQARRLVVPLEEPAWMRDLPEPGETPALTGVPERPALPAPANPTQSGSCDCGGPGVRVFIRFMRVGSMNTAFVHDVIPCPQCGRGADGGQKSA